MALVEVTGPSIGSLNEDKNLAFSLVWTVRYNTTPAEDGVSIVDRAIAAMNASHGSNAVDARGSVRNGATCISRSPADRPGGGMGTIWDITCNYSTEKDKAGQSAQSPYDVPSVVNWDTETLAVDLLSDANGDPVTNTAGDWFDPQPQDVKYRLRITINANVSGFTLSYWNVLNKINSSAVSIRDITFASGTLLVTNVRASEQTWSDGTEYVALGFDLAADPDGWKRGLYSVGYYEKVSNKRVPILDATGQPVTAPWPLQSDGTKFSTPDSTPYQQIIDVKEEASFAAITGVL